MNKLSIKGKTVGRKTKERTRAGRPVYTATSDIVTRRKNLPLLDEAVSPVNVSEISRTMEIDGKWINIPSIHNGQLFNQQQLKQLLKNKEIKPTSIHKSKEAAITAAKNRSSNLMKRKKGGGVGVGKALKGYGCVRKRK
jgi:hypothetical protein